MLLETLGAAAPAGAVVLFDGASAEGLSGWTNMEGGSPGWVVEEGCIRVVPGAGDICTKELFTDHFLHLEFMLSDMPEASGQGKSNSGVFLQGRYELQILDSSGWPETGLGACGAIYDQYAPLVNACLPPMRWQTYDVIFRAPRCEGKVVREKARVTVFQNGLIVQNNVELPGVTGAPSNLDVQLPGHLRLQDHGNVLWFRNIWAVRLPKEGPATYCPL